MEIAAKSHIGCVRSLNEDFYHCSVDLQGRVFAVVADGMGGHQAGDVASRMAVERIMAELKDMAPDLSPEDEREKLMNAILAANEEVFMYAQEHPECSGMGTTIVAALISPTHFVTAHIGDSRIYLYDGKQLHQKTEDHTLVQELLKIGKITEDEANHHPQRNIIMRALGTEKDVRIDLASHEWTKGDVLLLCSDGLSNKVSSQTMEQWLQEPVPLQEQVDALVQHALNAGGEDNITLIAVRNMENTVHVLEKEG